MELLQSVLRSGQLPTLKPLEVWRRAFRPRPEEPDIGQAHPEEPPPSAEKSPPAEENSNLENYRGSLEDYFRQKRKWKGR